jgi:hypothetical protein
VYTIIGLSGRMSISHRSLEEAYKAVKSSLKFWVSTTTNRRTAMIMTSPLRPGLGLDKCSARATSSLSGGTSVLNTCRRELTGHEVFNARIVLTLPTVKQLGW